MSNTTNNSFLFRCVECEKLISIELEDKDDVEKATNGELVLECGCGGDCEVLLD